MPRRPRARGTISHNEHGARISFTFGFVDGLKGPGGPFLPGDTRSARVLQPSHSFHLTEVATLLIISICPFLVPAPQKSGR